MGLKQNGSVRSGSKDKVRSRRGEAGMSMVEMVIVLPIVLVLLFAVVEFAVAFARWQVVSNAAREGARLAVVYRTPGTCVPAAVETEVRTVVKDYGDNIGITLTDPDIAVSGVCAAGPASTVVVNFRHDFIVIPNISGGVSPGIDLVGSSTMRNEG
jgi:hypothetical protein